MTARFFAFLLIALLACPVVQAQVLTSSNVQIDWKVVNRFRLFADPKDFKAHESAWRQYKIHVDGLGKADAEEEQYIATTSVLGTEHVLNDRYIPFSNLLRTKYDPRGWARPLVERLCYDSTERVHSSCGGVENYVSPKAHDIEVWLSAREQGVLVAEYNCEWRVDGGAAVTVPCDERVFLTLPYPGGGTISVNVEGEAPISIDARVKDMLIVGLGDSFASGEGNPDIPVAMSAEKRHRNLYPQRSRNDASGNAVWVDELCHRSLYGHQLRAALQIAVEQQQAAVTFLGYSCSGASIEDGILGPQVHMDYVSRNDGAISSVKGGSRDAQMRWLLREICAEKPERQDGLWSCPDNKFRRTVDLLLLSVGGNDIGFSQLVTWATLRDNTSSQIASFFGATVSPGDFADSMKDTLPSAYAKLAKAIEVAVPLLSGDSTFDPSRVVLSAYPDILQDETGEVCPAGDEGGKEDLFAANQSLDVYASWLVVTSKRLGKAHAQLAKLHSRMGELAGDHGWTFAGRAYEQQAFRGHGFCAQRQRRKDDPAEQLIIPCWGKAERPTASCDSSWSGKERDWRPYNPATEFFPYALRQRWVRTFNDAYMLVNQKVLTRDGKIDDRASESVFIETVGAMHPSAEGHAAMADAILLDIRSLIAATPQQ